MWDQLVQELIKAESKTNEHQTRNGANMCVHENIANLDKCRYKGAVLVSLLIKIRDAQDGLSNP